MEFRILGPLEVVEDGRQVDVGGQKQRALLAILLLHANEVVSTDRLIDAVWDDEPPETAHKALQVYVSGLRKALGKDRLETKAPGYRLRAEEGELDLERFERLAEERPREALSLWRGQPLAEFAYRRFAQTEIARLGELRLSCLERRIEEDLEQGRHAALVGELERLVREHPLRERLRTQLMLALYRSGRQAEALEAYQHARRKLTEELGIDPSQELRELQRAILAQDPELALQPTSAPRLPEAPPADAPEAEATRAREVRKTVTILFADVAGSTELGERFDPEALRRVYGRYFEEMSSILERHGGTVEKFIGDAVMAVFGIPVLHEDDPLRAVRAGLEMRERLALLNEELERQWGVRLVIRIGISMGEVVAGGSGAPTYATGDVVNVAARLQQHAGPGDILLGRETYRFVRDLVLAEPHDLGLVKGKGAPVETVRLLSLVADRPARSRFDSPMVGRGRERRRLQDAFEQAVSDSSCQLFTILGAAGVGKSRLVREFVSDVADRALVAYGRCLPYGEGITYWPVLEAVRDAAGLDDADSPEESLEKITRTLHGLEEAELVARRLGDVLGLSQNVVGAEEIFWAVRSFFEALGRDRSLILVFDDIHWAEPTFLDLVDHVADWARDAAILLIGVARPELLDARPHWSGGKLNATSVLLEPLSDAESMQLLKNLVGSFELGDRARGEIVGAADGNPLFVEEMLAYLLDEDPAATGVEVPPTIHALLAARLDRLEDGERAAIEAASVEGKIFHESSVAELLVRDPQTIERSLRALMRKELIRPDRGVFSGDRAYRFRHLLIRDAAYESIPKEARASLHERHASWLEERAGERALEFEEILGYHLEQAFRYRSDLGPVDGAALELARAAGTRIGTAGRRALARGDAPAATKLLARGAALLPAGDPLRVHLVPGVRSIQGLAEEIAWAEDVLGEALESRDASVELHARVQQALLRLFTRATADVDALVAIAEDSIRRFEALGDELGQARSWRLLQQARYLERQSAASADAAEEGLAHARKSDDPVEEGEILAWLGVALFMGATPAPEAERRVRAHLDQVRGSLAGQALLLGCLSPLVAMQGGIDEAHEILERSAAILEELGYFSQQLAAVPFHGGITELLAEDPIAAEAILRASLGPLEAIRDTSNYCAIVAVLARALYEQGRFAEAEELTKVSEQTAHLNDVFAHITWRPVRAKALAQRGELGAAEALAREAIAFAAASDFLNAHGDAFVDLAEVLELAGRVGEAVRAVERAIDLYDRKGNVVSARRARAHLERLAAAAGAS